MPPSAAPLMPVRDGCAAESRKAAGKPMYNFMKRAFDIMGALVGLVLSSPIMLVVAIMIKLEDGGPILFHEPCIGIGGKPVTKLKFRSMHVNANEILAQFSDEQKYIYTVGGKFEDDPRVTKIGNFIRKYSIDELPQFLTILQGNMSFVGPRIINEREIEFYRNDKVKFLSVMPGLTGYWQINGRSNVTYEQGERQKMELYYIDYRGLWFDTKILFMTIAAVIKTRGAM
jgi:lipopolysaccharide/colanic/teichoic acid biosynthesis glycosyltransferase